MAIKVTDSNFDGITSEGISVIDFFATWCGPCKAMGPIIDQISEDYSGVVKVGKLDVDENPNVSSRLSIRSIPTILIYKNGEVVEKHVGGASKTQIKSMIDKHLNDN